MSIDGVVGDPAGMRAYASRLRLLVESMAGATASVSRDVDVLTYEGPAATQFRGRMAAWRTDMNGAAAALQEAADAMERGAARVEAEQAEARLRARRDCEAR